MKDIKLMTDAEITREARSLYQTAWEFSEFVRLAELQTEAEKRKVKIVYGEKKRNK